MFLRQHKILSFFLAFLGIYCSPQNWLYTRHGGNRKNMTSMVVIPKIVPYNYFVCVQLVREFSLTCLSGLNIL